MYWLSINIQDTMIGHIQDVDSPKEAWDELVKIYETNTKARKLQLKNNFNTVSKKNLTVNEYALKIKGIVESLASIGVAVEDDDKVEVCLRGLTPAYKHFKTSIQTRENIPNFSNLISMLIIEEKNLGEDSTTQPKDNNSEQAFFSGKSRGRGRGGRGQRGGRGRNSYQGQQSDQKSYDSNRSTRGRGNSHGRGSQRGRKNQRKSNSDANSGCWTCGKLDHFERDCPWKEEGNSRQHNNYVSSSN